MKEFLIRERLGASSFEDIVDIFNSVYEGYSVPLSVDIEWMREHLEVHDICRNLSSIYHDQSGSLVGMALVGHPHPRAWIGGFGVVSKWRGRGMSHPMIEGTLQTLSDSGVRQVSLEVLEDNFRAFRCYQKAGFRFLRNLVGLEGSPGVLVQGCEAIPCWQRESGRHSRRSSERLATNFVGFIRPRLC